jgi:hypothetical protein
MDQQLINLKGVSRLAFKFRLGGLSQHDSNLPPQLCSSTGANQAEVLVVRAKEYDELKKPSSN